MKLELNERQKKSEQLKHKLETETDYEKRRVLQRQLLLLTSKISQLSQSNEV